MEHSFNNEELTVIFESALISLSDGMIFDSLAESMDLSDDYMKSIQKKLEIWSKNVQMV